MDRIVEPEMKNCTLVDIQSYLIGHAPPSNGVNIFLEDVVMC
jgi:hypothetical protein